MPLYEEIYNEAAKTLSHDDADILAANLSTMSRDEVRRLFDAVDNYEPTKSEQGLIPIPRGYNEQ